MAVMRSISLSEIEPRDRPGFGIGLKLLWLTVATSSVVEFEPAPYDLLVVGLLMLSLIAGWIRIPNSLGLPMTLFGLFLLANILSAMFSKEMTTSLLYMSITIYLVLSWLYFSCIIYEDRERAVRIIWNAYVLAGTMAACFAIIGYLHLGPGSDLFMLHGRAKGLFKDPNVLGPFIIPVAIYLVARLENEPKRYLLSTALLLPIVMTGILFSFSRAAAGNLVMGVFIYLALRAYISNSAIYRVRVLIIGVVVLVLGVTLVVIASNHPDVQRTLTNKSELVRDYDHERFSVQQRGLEGGFENPFGVGPGLTKANLSRGAHSLYVRVLFENGWIATLSLFTFVVFSFWRGLIFILRGWGDWRFVVAYASTAGMLGNSFFIDTLHWRHFFLIFALLWGEMAAHHNRTASKAEAGSRS